MTRPAAWSHFHSRDLRHLRAILAERNAPRLPWALEPSPADLARLDLALDAPDLAEARAEERAAAERVRARAARDARYDEALRRAVERAAAEGTCPPEVIAEIRAQLDGGAP